MDVILAERSRTLNDYIPKADVQTQIDKALEAAKKDAPQVNVLEAPEYKEPASGRAAAPRRKRHPAAGLLPASGSPARRKDRKKPFRPRCRIPAR